MSLSALSGTKSASRKTINVNRMAIVKGLGNKDFSIRSTNRNSFIRFQFSPKIEKEIYPGWFTKSYLRSMGRDEQFMNRAIQLAKLGIGKTNPNPLVGAVIVHNDIIIGEGYHQKFGEAHAEVNAINSVIDQSILPASTIYVTLEPCSHFGKTPPCADLICSKQFKRVVIGSLDPHEKVSGKGVQKLREHGIEVEVGVQEKECRALNKGFLTFHEKKRPYVLLKWAMSSDGFIDNNGVTTRISCPESDLIVQSLRNEYHAIMVGKTTALKDDPGLNCRLPGGSNPIRILLDSKCEVSMNKKLFDGSAPTLILNTVKSTSSGLNNFVKISNLEPSFVLNELYNQGIVSVLIEGGSQVLQSFIDSENWDEILVIQGNSTLKNGTKAPTITVLPNRTENVGKDKHFYFIKS